MPTTNAPNPDALSPAVDTPNDGELADAASLGAIPKVFDNGFFALKRIGSSIGPGPALYARADGTPDAKSIKVKPIAGAVIHDTAVRFMAVATETTINEANLSGAVNFAINTVYHVYLKFSAGVPTFEISATAPDVYRLFKSGGTTHRFLFSFITDGSANVRRFSQNRDMHVFHTAVGISSGSPVAAEDKSFAGLVPIYVRIIRLRCSVQAGAGAIGLVWIGPKGTDVTGGDGQLLIAGINGYSSECLDCPLDEDQKMSQIVNLVGTTSELSLQGWLQ